MKLREYADLEREVKEEISNEQAEQAKILVKNSLQNIAKAKSILKKLEDKHQKLLDSEVADLETGELEY